MRSEETKRKKESAKRERSVSRETIRKKDALKNRKKVIKKQPRLQNDMYPPYWFPGKEDAY